MTDPAPVETVPPGTMLLHDSFDPPLGPGTYIVTVTTDVTEDGSTAPLATYADSTYVAVATPSEALGPNDVVMVHPPANSTVASAEELPHIVLRRPTLPWESQEGTPWLALLVVDPSAVTVAGGNVTVPDSTVLPQSSDVALLCHVREVSIDASDPTIEDGRFAVVVANRLPAPSGQQLACLVSTVGMAEGTPPGVSQSLSVLYSWSFTVAEGGGFEAAMRLVAANAKPVELSQAAPLSLVRVARDGTTSQAPYHGPLVGSLSAPGSPTDPSDPSYEIAGQLGAQLAAANRDLLRVLYDWRRQDQQGAQGPTLAAEIVEAPLTTPAAPPVLASPAPGRPTPESIVAAGLAHLPALTAVVKVRRSPPSAGPALASHDVVVPGPGGPAPASTPPASPSPAGAAQPGLPASAGAPPPPEVAAFIQDLSELRGVPFTYLLPDPALLPPESIRFFYLDVDWLAEVAAGMLGVFGAGGRAQGFASSQAPTLRAMIYQALAEGAGGPEPTSTASTVVSGFLLRSIVVSNWPQAQFRAFATVPPDAAPASTLTVPVLPPFRLEKLTSTLMVGLYPGPMAALWVEEPHHALAFGVVFAGGQPTVQSTGAVIPTRSSDGRTLDITALAAPQVPPWTSAKLASVFIDDPYRQVFR